MIKTNLIKIVAFIVRTVTFISGLLLLIMSSAIVTQLPMYSNRPDYTWMALSMFFAGMVLAFPFRFLKLRDLIFYFRLLMSITIGYIIFSIFLQNFDLVGWSVLLLHLYFVYAYVHHRQDPIYANPFIEAKTIRRLILPVTALVLLGIGILCFLFLDIRETPQGKSYIHVPVSIPSSEVSFTHEALTNDYKLESWYYQKPYHAVSARITKKSVKNKDFIELQENGKKIFRIEFDEKDIIKTETYNTNGEKQMIQTYIFGRTKEGVFTGIDDKEFYTADLSHFDLIIVPLKMYTKESLPNVSEINVEVRKVMSYPKKPQFIPLPFVRSSIPWDLQLKDSQKTIPLVNKILLWY